MKIVIYGIAFLFLSFLFSFLLLGLLMSNDQKEQKEQIEQETSLKEEIKRKELRIIFSSDIAEECNISRNTAKTTGGCYINGSSLIYINTNMNSKHLSYVLTHEIGHWIIEDKDISIFNYNWETAADSYSDWILNRKLDFETKKYFDNLWYVFFALNDT